MTSTQWGRKWWSRLPVWSLLIVPLGEESPGFPFGPPRMERGHLFIAQRGCESRLPAQCLLGRGTEAAGFWWPLAGVEQLISKSFCLARLPFPRPLAWESRHVLELFLGGCSIRSGMHTVAGKPGNSPQRCSQVLSILASRFLLSTFQSSYVCFIYIVFRIFSYI